MYMADFRFAPSQWETSLQSNAVSHWLGANLHSALNVYDQQSNNFIWHAQMAANADDILKYFIKENLCILDQIATGHGAAGNAAVTQYDVVQRGLWPYDWVSAKAAVTSHHSECQSAQWPKHRHLRVAPYDGSDCLNPSHERHIRDNNRFVSN